MSKPVSFSDLDDAFDFVSCGAPCEHVAVLCRETGTFHYRSEMGDLDEMPEDVDEEGSAGKYIGIPHKNDLDLGQRLVMDFVAERLPDDYAAVEGMFHGRGAYGRFKDLLARRGLLDDWYAYEKERTDAALREWCAENDIELAE